MGSFDGVFFKEWPTWAQLSFILCCCLFVVFTVAYIVKLKNFIQDRRFEKKMAAEQAERGEMTPVNRISDEIPFGIRALIEDAGVEGVWNSRAMTPLHQNEDAETRSNPPGPPVTLRRTSRRNSSVSSTSLYDAADIGNAVPSASGSAESPKLQVRPLPTPPGTRRYIIGGRQKNVTSYPRHAASEQMDPLERMKAVRSIHAAESGQLIPRWSSVY